MATKAPRPGSFVLATAIALLFALAARLPFFLRSDFPLNDGGMFLTMSEDILANRYALPVFTSYNLQSIPFAYPPLSFYMVAALSGITGLEPIALVRYLPLVANLATVVGVAFLARSLLGSGWAALLAPTVFALHPRGYEWMIMGGGLTRSVGFMFAVFCLSQARPLYAHLAVWRILLCGALAAATLASHLEMGIFVIYSLLLMAVTGRRILLAIPLAFLLAMLAVVLTAPWWVGVLSRHGFAPFDAASLTSYWSSLDQSVGALERYVFQPGLVLGALGIFAFLGMIACVLRGEFFLPLWLPFVFIWVPRSAQSEGAVPLALLGAVGLAKVVGPGLLVAAERARPTAVSWIEGSLVHPLSSHPSHGLRVFNALGLLLLLAAVFLYSPKMHPDRAALDSLSAADRGAMGWVAENVPPTAQFLVLSTTRGWEADRVGEWFPVIAGRRSLLTPQGSEWLPSEVFERNLCLFDGVRDLAAAGNGIDQLDRWAQGRGLGFSHIYVSKEALGPVDYSALIASAKSSPSYRLLIDNPSVTVLERTAPIRPAWSPDGDVLVSRDCQTLADQDEATQEAYAVAHGEQAAWAWVQERDRSLGEPATLCGRLEGLRLTRFGLVDSLCGGGPEHERVSAGRTSAARPS